MESSPYANEVEVRGYCSAKQLSVKVMAIDSHLGGLSATPQGAGDGKPDHNRTTS